ncbi:MAG TPA: DmsC/YnfH family molybdoenzyme membrane anchor subunit [Caldimonas sp.]|jgi:DMSO reductase anchor subunit|nr:DmsC/YnfH family molybdoenzyme membrane anchor subunit [Caldimonas sp.]HEV7578023.1 DmsC/YnfH family molybdoenzyme membrane anchor subunit [Caldimonas sp.]
MNPAFSVVVFTVLAGAAQGLVVALALAVLAGVSMSAQFLSRGLLVAVVLLVLGLGASFLHLGRPERAWRSAMMWRTSWLSREVIALPAFIGLVALWWWASRFMDADFLKRALLPGAALALAALLWYCTAMIYACLRFIEEWAHPLTLVNFVALGLSSGFVLASALAAIAGESTILTWSGPIAIALTLVAWVTRMTALRRNAGIRHRSTLQTATGLRSPRLVQTSMGMSAGSFNTREFFHCASRVAMQRIRLAVIGLAFVAPLAAMLMAWLDSWPALWLAAFLLQVPGLIADRWYFFAQAKHPQNLYYQVVS